MNRKNRMRRKAIFSLMVLVMVLSGCSLPSNGEELVPEELHPDDEITALVLEGDVQLQGIEVFGAGTHWMTHHETYGHELLPLSLLTLFLQDVEEKASGRELISFSIADKMIDLEVGTAQYYVDGEQKTALGPSFKNEVESYVHASVLQQEMEHVSATNEGYSMGEIPEDSMPTSALRSFLGELGHMTLINKMHGVEREKTGQHLINLNETYPQLKLTKNDMLFNEQAAVALQEMLDEAADTEGMETIYVVSTYRSFDYQQGLYERKINQYRTQFGYDEETATIEAGRIVAIPGTSEHQSGLAVDFTSQTMMNRGQVLEQDFLETVGGAWLVENAARFGFILRYPSDTEEITGIMEEAWHYRYVGLPHSLLIQEGGFVLETYIDYLKDVGALAVQLDSGERYRIVYVDAALADVIFVEDAFISVSDTNEGGLILTMRIDQ